GATLENPFASVPGMISAFYPQRRLPYHYMGPLVWDKWDAVGATSHPKPGSALARMSKGMPVLVSEHDELVPPTIGRQIAQTSGARLSTVRCALHETAWMKKRWQDEMARYI
ncbi:hypothetical protein K488DRAFT_12881, partial [Vararia minispora EC-137]